jgi:hypothetical protein
MTGGWVGLAVSAAWGVGSAQLVLQGWLATADVFIALAGLARGRMSGTRAFESVVGAVIVGVVCSVLLRGGFWLLVERMAFGQTWQEQVVHLTCLGTAASFMLAGVPAKLRRSWHAAMTPQEPSES